ncbi:NAD kinase [soil metagenome]
MRRVLVVVHTGRDDARAAARRLWTRLAGAGVGVRLLSDESDRFVDGAAADEPPGEVVAAGPDAATGCELVVVIGGDGTILRGAELARPAAVPLLGVNLGHVGFLAEAEFGDLDATADSIVHRRWQVEERLTIDAVVRSDGAVLHRCWALNEASVEKASRQRMLEVVVEVDGRPLSRWGGDGLVCATPTGSTAYAFSAGGPVVWPEVAALLVVPLSAHALFARPMVVSPQSTVAVELIASTPGVGVLWCDGRRTYALPPGARVEMRAADRPVLLARLHQAPFTDRLVRKFGLPVTGWRGRTR